MVLLLTFGVASSTRAAAPDRTQWKLASFTWVTRVPAEPGAAANAHPANLSDAAITAALGPVLATVDGRSVPLFAKDELAGLIKALREAFSLAKPGEDLVLLSSNKRGGMFLEVAQGITARLFVREGALNLIVHDARLAFLDRFYADNTLPKFEYGSRQTASTQNLQAPGAARQRGDWLALSLTAAPAPAAAVTAAVAPPATPTPAAPAAPANTRDAAFYEAQTQRLKALKKLRGENLLTEAEYQEKREAILKTL
ncbi:MAG TPA: hypothetical protein VF378_14695 [Geothrix sp.]